MTLNVYIASITANTEVRKQVQKVLMVLDGLGVPFKAIDITLRGNEEHRDFMRENAVNDRCDGVPLPPQFFVDGEYLGNYLDFEEAVEENQLPEFLRLIPSSKKAETTVSDDGSGSNENADEEDEEDENEEGTSESNEGEGSDEYENEGDKGEGSDEHESEGDEGEGSDEHENEGDEGEGSDEYEDEGDEGEGSDEYEDEGEEEVGKRKDEIKTVHNESNRLDCRNDEDDNLEHKNVIGNAENEEKGKIEKEEVETGEARGVGEGKKMSRMDEEQKGETEVENEDEEEGDEEIELEDEDFEDEDE